MPLIKPPGYSRRSFLKSSAAKGAALAAGASGISLFNINRSFAAMKNPADILATINVGNKVNKDYRAQYKLGDNDLLWDPKKDWIRTVDWEAVRKEHAGKTVRFAIGAADADSAKDDTFTELSGIKVELVPIPDDSMYDKVVAEFLGGKASFDALQFFSPWLGDFAAQGFLAKLDDYAAKWKLPLDDFYETYRLNYGYFGDKGMYGIPFDCDIQQVHIRPSIIKKVTGKDVDRVNTIPSYAELVKMAPEIAKVEKGVSAIGMMNARGFWATYNWEHVAAQHGMMLFNDKWEPIFNGDAGVKGLETIIALSKHAIEGHAGADCQPIALRSLAARSLSIFPGRIRARRRRVPTRASLATMCSPSMSRASPAACSRRPISPDRPPACRRPRPIPRRRSSCWPI